MAKNDDNNNGWQMIAYFAIAVIVVSLFVVGMRLTGFVVDTAVLNVTVDKTAAINFTSDFINFGNGSVNVGASSATLESDQTAATGGTWAYSAQHFVLQNIGNADVVLNLATGKNAADFLGGTSPSYKYKVADTESGSCANIAGTSWTDVNKTGIGDTVCTNFKYADATDRITIDVQLVIPSDSNSGTGAFTDTFTATGTAI